MRLDLFLVQNKLANSRTQAHDFILNGFVYILRGKNKIRLTKASFAVGDSDRARIFVEANLLQKFVSRAGLKLEFALETLDLPVKEKIVLDIGQSTGGFSDCLVQHGALRVVGVDVGHGQLHSSLKNHPKIVSLEGLNAKDLAKNPQFLSLIPPDKFDLIVMDVSFISITKVIGSISGFLKKGGVYLFLVKPQFECGRGLLDRNGIVADDSVFGQIEQSIKKIAQENFKNVEAYFKSDIIGKDGNQEYFIYGKNST